MAGWLKKLFSPSQGRGQTPTADLPPLTDSDFEFLLDQLLQGISRGWQPDRLEVFIADLGVRGKVTAWEAWLERFSTQILSQAQRPQQQQIGTKLFFVSNAFKGSPKLQRFARAFAESGQLLLTGQGKVNVEIWEYDGADQLAEPAPSSAVTPVTLETAEIASPEVPAAAPEELPTETSEQPLEAVPEAMPASPERTAACVEEPSISPEAEPESAPEPVAMAEPPNPEDTGNGGNTTVADPVSSPAVPGDDSMMTIEALFKAGLTKAEEGDFLGAIALWDQVKVLNPELAAVWHNRGSAFAYLKRYDEALISLDRAIQLAPDNVLVWNDRSAVLMALEQWQAALESWNKTIELQEDLTEAWYQRGLTLEQLHKPENAQINYRRVLSLQPDFTQAQVRLDALEAILNAPVSPLPADPWAE
ncbi:MAG: tetratricopeptide repeat protein [Synechococcus sp.]|nr:tetratricopeptide repeat protein [Synechococcus sp.]